MTRLITMRVIAANLQFSMLGEKTIALILTTLLTTLPHLPDMLDTEMSTSKL